MSYSIKEDNSGYILNDILWIAPENEYTSNSLLTITEEEAERNSEERLQLKEGYSYEYEILNKQYKFEEISGIVHPSRKNLYRGRLTPGNYVGRLPLKIISETGIINIAVEIRSSKSDYRTEYRKMLEDITTECTELLMIHSSPAVQRFSVDYGNDSETLYQRFSFVQSMVDSEDFHNAVQRIINSPITRWKTEVEELDSRRVKRIGSSQIRQLASGSNRIPLPKDHFLSSSIGSLPRKLTTTIKSDTLDNPENRFIKHTLNEFARFAGSICQKINNSGTGRKPNIFYEAKKLEDKLSEYLSHNMFKEVSQVKTLPLNNPVLQRKEGYREVFRIWLMYDLAAKLTWNGLNQDTYHAGKRDVATLYEYWLFFKLLRMIEEIFQIEPVETKKLIKETSDGLGLQLKSGRHTAVEGKYSHKKRNLKIKYNYNRTFQYAEYPNGGSWTQKMRPDYTLSFWPVEFTETEAEKQELIVHIHFDAKYKVQDLEYLIHYNKQKNTETETEELDNEKELEKSGKYKRADLLKMHAYKDAIRRTAGAYVIYPGSESLSQKGFHELIPGLGAFAVSPSSNGGGIESVKHFILKVLDHYTNRTTQRERHSFDTYKNMKDIPGNLLHEKVPEFTINSLGEKQRIKPLQETNVLIGYVQQKQKDWISEHHIYNIRIDKEITPQIAGAEYLLLYDSIIDGNKLHLWKNGFFRIINNPIIQSKDWLLDKNYPDPGELEYFIYEISTLIEEWSLDKVVDIYLKEDEEKYRPITRILPEIMR